MHSLSKNIDGELFIVHHNGDFSGDIKIVIKNIDRVDEFDADTQPYYTVDLPFDLIKAIMANWIRNDLIDKIEKFDG